MPELTLLQRARQGDPTAIAMLINRQLQPKGLSAAVQRHGAALQVEITAQQLPSPKLSAYLHRAFQKLQPQGIAQVHLSVQQTAATAIAWTDTIELFPADALAPAHASSTPVAPPASKPSPAPPEISPIRNGLTFWANWIAANIGATLIMAILVAVPIGVVLAITNSADFLTQWVTPRPAGQSLIGVPALFLRFFIFFAVFGLIIGDAQAAILRRWLTGMGWWRLATALGIPLGLLVSEGCHAIAQTMLPNRDLLLWLAWCLSLMLGSATLALCQWVVLGRRISGVWTWLLGNALSIPLAVAMTALVGLFVGQRVVTVVLPVANRATQDGIVAATVLILLWLMIHGVVGAVLAWLLRHRPPLATQS